MNESNRQKRRPYKHMPNSRKILKYIYIYNFFFQKKNIYKTEFKLYHMQIIMIQILTIYDYNL